MNDEPHLHAQPRAAEVAAAAVVAPHVRAFKDRILEAALNAGDDGIIPDEVDGLINTVRRRFTDLWKAGRLRPTDRTRKNRRGNPETVWILGRDEKATGARVSPALIREAVLTMLKQNGGPIDGYVGSPDVWTKDAYVMVRREDFDALDKMTRGGPYSAA